jgi:hypothetical protein
MTASAERKALGRRWIWQPSTEERWWSLHMLEEEVSYHGYKRVPWESPSVEQQKIVLLFPMNEGPETASATHYSLRDSENKELWFSSLKPFIRIEPSDRLRVTITREDFI